MKPILIFDGDCGFCRVWIRRWHQTTGARVDYLPFQDSAVRTAFPEIPQQQFEQSVNLILPDGKVITGAEAAFRALATNPNASWLQEWYGSFPTFARASELGYRVVARNRRVFSLLTKIGWGAHAEKPTHFLVRWVFLRGIALAYLAAFISLWVQIPGMIGSNGILPASATMEAARQHFSERGVGWDRFHLFPTICWFDASDRSLTGQCAAGTLLSILLLLGIAPAPVLFLLWLLYLSLSTVGQEFLSFQWDTLLLEAGFLAIFFAPLQGWPRLARVPRPSGWVLWLLRWLLFRLMFESGVVKLLSGDKTWRDLTALLYHYETQPLPTFIGWYAHQLPRTIQEASTALMFIIELAVPFLIFCPRRPRHFACLALILLQVCILLTGNYCFFNFLTIILCIPLLDDFTLRKLPWLKRFADKSDAERSGVRWPSLVTLPLAGGVVVFTLVQMAVTTGFTPRTTPEISSVFQWFAPFRSLNTYGLFAVMTTVRNEIVVEGSNDGTNWQAYEFKYKPGDVSRRPAFVAPHQPRLDWQMWFAALSDYRRNPWFVNFCVRLLQGSPEVLRLIEHNPFPTAPPKHIRAVVYEYHFTDWTTRRKTAAWWRREMKGIYLAPISLRQTSDSGPMN